MNVQNSSAKYTLTISDRNYWCYINAKSNTRKYSVSFYSSDNPKNCALYREEAMDKTQYDTLVSVINDAVKNKTYHFRHTKNRDRLELQFVSDLDGVHRERLVYLNRVL
jgi:hypothetical protein